jgi:hypothetical protein
MPGIGGGMDPGVGGVFGPAGSAAGVVVGFAPGPVIIGIGELIGAGGFAVCIVLVIGFVTAARALCATAALRQTTCPAPLP